jgi:hypothetical protein
LILLFPKKKNYQFSGRLGTFYRFQTDFYEKKNRCSATCHDEENFIFYW